MKKVYERSLGRILDIIGQAVAFFACLPVCIAFIAETYFLYNFFKNNGFPLPDYVWSIIGLGCSCFIFVFLIFSMAIMEAFIKSFKELIKSIWSNKLKDKGE